MGALKKKLGGLFHGDIKGQLAWLFRLTKANLRGVLIYTLLGVISVLSGLACSVTMRYLIDAIPTRNSELFGRAAIVFISFGIAKIVFTALSGRISEKISLDMRLSLNRSVFDAIVNSKWMSVSKYQAGDLINRLNSDVNSVIAGVLGATPSIMINTVKFFAVFAIILVYDPILALLACVGLPLSALFSRYILKRIYIHSKEVRSAGGRLTAFVGNCLSNLEQLKGLGLSSVFLKKYDKVLADYKKASLDYNRISVLSAAVISLVGQLAMYVCGGWGLYRLWRGEISFGTLAMFIQLSSYLSSAFSALVGAIAPTVSSMTAAGRIIEVEALQKEAESELDIVPFGEFRSVELADICFAYDGSDNSILSQSNFEARAGERTALIGESGLGKTTVLRLLLSMVDKKEGKAVLHFENGDIELGSNTRACFAYVPQENSVFSDTVAANLRLVKPTATDEELIDALKQACAYDFVKELPHGIYSLIGEGSHGLSEGQLRRIAIARVFLSEAAVVLLDEATSPLDPAISAKIFDNICARQGGRACIYITHRPELLRYADRIYTIKDGRALTLSSHLAQEQAFFLDIR